MKGITDTLLMSVLLKIADSKSKDNILINHYVRLDQLNEF